ncbi:MAG: ATP-binding protein [Bacteroidales bacterium]|nr:ATP-binding protein [Bacteroidales bacterium]
MKEYFTRIIDDYLIEWKNDSTHKPLLLRGARQVGKSSAAKHLGKQFKYFAEINFERQREAKAFFSGDFDVKLIAGKISNYVNVPIEPGKTLLFLDEIQECQEAIMALRFFKEDYPDLHVIAAGSLLEFALESLSTFGVGRIHSLFMYPMTFDEFLVATGNQGLANMRDMADSQHPLDLPFHDKLVEMFRIYLMVGGMPEAVATWVNDKDFLRCQKVHNDIILTYEDDFNKYKKKANPDLLRVVMRSVCHQVGKPVSLTKIARDVRSQLIREALRQLTQASIIIPVIASAANGIPLDAEAKSNRVKYLFLDPGLLLSVLQLDQAESRQLMELIMLGSPHDLVNKGAITEMFAGLEMARHKSPIQRPKMYYWEKTGNSTAEVDYLQIKDMEVLPIEVKASTQGGMKSLWTFMREKHLHEAVRCSLENFGEFDYSNPQDNGEIRHVRIVPLYAMGKI